MNESSDNDPKSHRASPESEDAFRCLDSAIRKLTKTRPDLYPLLRQLDWASVELADIGTPFIASITIDNNCNYRVSAPDGPIPRSVYVKSPDGEIVGMLVPWISNGLLSTLEYAWLSERAPRKWPNNDEIFAP